MDARALSIAKIACFTLHLKKDGIIIIFILLHLYTVQYFHVIETILWKHMNERHCAEIFMFR